MSEWPILRYVTTKKGQVTTKNIKKDRLCMKSPVLEVLFAKGAFQIQSHISGVNFSNDISIPHITWHNFETSQSLTINLKMNPSIIFL